MTEGDKTERVREKEQKKQGGAKAKSSEKEGW